MSSHARPFALWIGASRALWCAGGAGAAAVAYAAADHWLPSHLPPGVLLRGAVLGGLQGLVAMGLVLVYRSARIINFAQTAIGGLAASLAIVLVTGEHWSYYAAVPLGLAGAVVTGLLVDRLVARRFTHASRMVFTVATIGLAQLLGAAQVELPRQLKPSQSTTSFTTPFAFHFHLDPFTFSGNDLVALAVVPVALAALFWFFQRTDTGTAIRAAADASERAVLLGIPVRRLSTIAWAVAAGLSGVGAILAAPIVGQNVGVASGPATLLMPLAAAVLAGMESLPMTVVWSVVLSVVSQASSWSYHQAPYTDAIEFVVILAALMIQRRTSRRTDDGDSGGFVNLREVARAPASLAGLPVVRWAKVVGFVGIVAAAVVLPLHLPAPRLGTLTYVPIYGIIAVSLVVLAGWAGQISLGHYALVGIGAAFTGALAVHVHLNLLLAMVVAAATGAVVACVLGIPALRIQGLYLAVVTLAFAVVASTLVLSSAYVPWLTPATVRPPVLFARFDLHSPYTLYEFCLLFLVLTMLLAWNIRRSWAGRVVVAVRDNPRAAAAYGISPLKSRLTAFAVAGALAGVAGSLLVVAQQGIPQAPAGFTPDESVNVFAMTVIGGMSTLTGAVLGALYIRGATSFLNDVWQLVVSGAGLLVVLMVWPEGLGGVVFQLRDRALSVLARRRRGTLSELSGDAPAQDAAHQGPTPEVAPSDAPSDPSSTPVHTAALRLVALEDLETRGPIPGLERGPLDAHPPGGALPVLSLAHIGAGYGDVEVLRDMSLGVAQGEVVALLGTNGAGKTTALKAAAGLVPLRVGSVTYFGTDISTWSPRQRVEAGLVSVFGGRDVFSSLTVGENMRMAAWMARRRRGDDDFTVAATRRVFEMFPRLKARKRQRAGLLSGGERQMLALAQALLCRPRVLLIDELSQGLAPTVVAQLVEVVRALADSGVTVVIVEQSVNLATSVSDRAVFIERGRLRFSGPTPDLSRQPDLLRSVFLHAANRAKQRMELEAHPRPGSATPSRALSADDVAALLGGAAGPSLPPGGPDDVIDRREELDDHPGADARTWSWREAGSATSLVAVPDGAAVEDARSTGDGPMDGATTEDATAGHARSSDRADSAAYDESAAGLVVGGDGEPDAALEVLGATKRYGGVAALTDVNVRVMPGEIVGVIGSNGAGKTTLFDVCSGFVLPDAGRVRLFGRDVTNMSPARRAARGLGRVFQDSRLFPAMTVAEVLRTSLERVVPVRDAVACALRLPAVIESEEYLEARVDDILGAFGLARFRHHQVSELSSGTRRVLDLASAFGHDSGVLLLDEPSAGIAQRESEALGELLLDVRDRTGATFVVIEHDVPLVAAVADRLVCLHLGSVIAEGTTASVLDDPIVIRAYLGADAAHLDGSTPGAARVGAMRASG